MLAWTLVNPEVETPKFNSIPAALRRSASHLATDPPAPNYVAASVSTYSFTAEAMAEVGFSSMLKFKSEANVGFFLIEVAAYTDTVIVEATDHKRLQLVRLGAGFRVGIAVWKVSVDASANIGLVAASTAIKAAQTHLQLVQNGLSDGMVDIIEPLKDFSDAGPDFLRALSVVADELTTALVNDSAQITPQVLQVAALDLEAFTMLNAAASNRFAVERVQRSQSMESMDTWIRERWDAYGTVISPATVASAYRAFGILSNEATPTQVEHDEAWNMDRLGW